MSWNPPKDKNKEQPKRRGVKGKQFNFIINQISLIYGNNIINIAWEDDEVNKKPKFIKKNNQDRYSNTNNTNNTNFENYYVKENNKSAYETAYNDYNRQNNISNNPISKNDAYNNPNIYKNSNM